MLPFLRSRPALLGALAVDALGNGCAGPLMLLFLTRSAGLRLTTVGAVLSAANLAALVMPPLVGMAVARWGALRVVIAAQVLQGVAYAGYLRVHTAWQLGIVALVAAVGQRLFWSSIFGLVDAVGDGDSVFAEVGAVQAAGIGAGALLAGVLISAPGTGPLVAIVALDAVSFAVSAGLLLRLPSVSVATTALSAPLRSALRDGRYVSLVAANVLFASCSMLLGVGLPILLYYHLRSPHWVIGAVLAASTVVIAFGQPWGVRHRPRRLTAVLILAGMLWCAWGLVTALATTWPGGIGIALVCVGAIFYSLAELWHAPASPALAASCAPTEHRASYLALFQYGFAVANVVVPVTFTSLDARSPALPWLAGAGAAAVGAGIVALLRDADPQ